MSNPWYRLGYLMEDTGVLIDPSLNLQPEHRWESRMPKAVYAGRNGLIKAQVLEHIPSTDSTNSTNKDKIKADQYICRDILTGQIYAGCEEAFEAGTPDSGGYRIRQGIIKEGAGEGLDTKNEEQPGEYVYLQFDCTGWPKIVFGAKHPDFELPEGLKENDCYSQINGHETITKADGTKIITDKGGAKDKKTGKRPKEATAGTVQKLEDGKFSITNPNGGEFSMDTKTGKMEQLSKDRLDKAVGNLKSKVTGAVQAKVAGAKEAVTNGFARAKSSFDLNQGGGPLTARQGDRAIATNAHGAPIVATIMDGSKKASCA